MNAEEIVIRPHQWADKTVIKRFLEELQDYLVEIDDLSLTRRLPAYGEKFTKQLLEAVRKHDGLILVAEHDNKPIGFIAGIVYERTKEGLLEATPARSGRVLELFVIQEYRDQKIGTALMEQMEEYFRRKKCDVCRVEVFNPNKMAYRFYQALGYQNRMIDLIKVLRETN